MAHKSEFHIGDRVKLTGQFEGIIPDFTVTQIHLDGTHYSGEGRAWWPEDLLDYSAEPSREDQRRTAHLVQLEQIHHQVGTLLEEGRCIAEAYWDDMDAQDFRYLMEDVDLLSRVHSIGRYLKQKP